MESRLAYLAIPLLGYVAYAMFRFSLGVALPAIQLSYGLSDVEAGLMVSLGSISLTIFILYGGYLTDKLGVSLSFLVGASLFSLGLVLFTFSLNFWMLAGFLFLAGVGGGILIPTVYSWIGEALASHRGLSIGITNAFFGLGGFLGSWATGSLLRLGFLWVSPFHLFALVSLVSAACTAVGWRIRVWRGPVEGGETGDGGYLTLLRSKNMLLLFFAMLFSNVSYFNFIVWMPSFLLRIQGFTIDECGIALALFSLVGSLGAIGFGYLYGRAGRSLLASTLGLASALCFLPIVLLRYSLPMGVFLFSGFGFLLYPYWNLIITMAQESVGREAVGRATGLVQSAGLLSSVIGPFTAGILIEEIGMFPALLLTVLSPLLAYTLIILGWRIPSRS